MGAVKVLRTVDNLVVGFSTPKFPNPVSWLVRLITRSKASHAWVAYHDPTLGIDVVVEAHELGFRMLKYDNFVAKNNVVAIFRLKYSPQSFMPYMSRWLGTVYDFLGLIGIGVSILGKYLGWKHLKNPFDSPDAVFCSESIVRALKAMDPVKYGDLDENNTTPQGLMDFLEASLNYR